MADWADEEAWCVYDVWQAQFAAADPAAKKAFRAHLVRSLRTAYADGAADATARRAATEAIVQAALALVDAPVAGYQQYDALRAAVTVARAAGTLEAQP